MFIVEDDWVRDLDFGASTPPPIARTDEHGHVIYLRSISKVSAPGIRIGAVIARGPAAARLRAVRTIADFFASPLLQLTVQELFADRGWERHLQTLRNELRERRDALAAGLRVTSPTASFTIPTGGVALWVRLPLNIDELSFVAECKSRGVAVSPGCHFWISEPEAPHVRISFATASVEALADAARRIGNALDSIQATTPTS